MKVNIDRVIDVIRKKDDNVIIKHLYRNRSGGTSNGSFSSGSQCIDYLKRSDARDADCGFVDKKVLRINFTSGEMVSMIFPYNIKGNEEVL